MSPLEIYPSSKEMSEKEWKKLVRKINNLKDVGFGSEAERAQIDNEPGTMVYNKPGEESLVEMNKILDKVEPKIREMQRRMAENERLMVKNEETLRETEKELKELTQALSLVDELGTEGVNKLSNEQKADFDVSEQDIMNLRKQKEGLEKKAKEQRGTVLVFKTDLERLKNQISSQ